MERTAHTFAIGYEIAELKFGLFLVGCTFCIPSRAVFSLVLCV